MTTLTEGPRNWGFLLSEAEGSRSRQNGTLRQGQNLQAGTVLQWFNGVKNGTLVAFTASSLNTDGYADPPVAGILGARTDASTAAQDVAYIDCDAEVNIHNLITPDETSAGGEVNATILGLGLLGIKVRTLES